MNILLVIPVRYDFSAHLADQVPNNCIVSIMIIMLLINTLWKDNAQVMYFVKLFLFPIIYADDVQYFDCCKQVPMCKRQNLLIFNKKSK